MSQRVIIVDSVFSPRVRCCGKGSRGSRRQKSNNQFGQLLHNVLEDAGLQCPQVSGQQEVADSNQDGELDQDA